MGQDSKGTPPPSLGLEFHLHHDKLASNLQGAPRFVLLVLVPGASENNLMGSTPSLFCLETSLTPKSPSREYRKVG